MIPNFTIFFISQIFIFKFFFTNRTGFCIFKWFLLLFVNKVIFFFLKFTIFIACSIKDSQNVFTLFLLLYTSWLFSMILNDDIVDIEKPDETHSPTFIVNEFSGLFLEPSIFPIKHSRSEKITNGALSDVWY